MAEKLLKKGDGVRLLSELEARELRDAQDKPYWMAEPTYDAKKKKGPHSLFEVVLGVYMGTKYVSTRDRRADNGRVDKLRHSFFFNNTEVFIDPRHVEIVARFDDGKDIAE